MLQFLDPSLKLITARGLVSKLSPDPLALGPEGVALLDQSIALQDHGSTQIGLGLKLHELGAEGVAFGPGRSDNLGLSVELGLNRIPISTQPVQLLCVFRGFISPGGLTFEFREPVAGRFEVGPGQFQVASQPLHLGRLLQDGPVPAALVLVEFDPGRFEGSLTLGEVGAKNLDLFVFSGVDLHTGRVLEDSQSLAGQIKLGGLQVEGRLGGEEFRREPFDLRPNRD